MSDRPIENEDMPADTDFGRGPRSPSHDIPPGSLRAGKRSSDNQVMAAVVDAIPPAQDAHGVYRIGGTRVTLDLVVRGFQRGATAEEIVQLGRYANLSPSTGSFSVCEMSIGACIFPGPHSPGQLAGLRVPWS